MKVQVPAEGISITRRFEDSIFYKVDCQCGNPDDEINFEIEIDSEVNEVIVNQWTVQKTNWWTEVFKAKEYDNEHLQALSYLWAGFVNGFLRRLKFTWNYWVHGYAKYESTTVLSKQQAINYANALLQGVKDLEKLSNKK